jgi:hypothetical protein
VRLSGRGQRPAWVDLRSDRFAVMNQNQPQAMAC